MNKKLALAFIIIAVALIGYKVMSRRRTNSQPFAAAAIEKELKPKATKVAPGGQPASTRASKPALSTADFERRRFVAHKGRGNLVDLPLDGDGAFILKVRSASPEPKCAAGDIDAIAAELQATGEKDVLLTVEQADGRDDPIVSRRMTVAELLANPEIKVALPSREVAAYGVYVCRDLQKTGRCFGKKLRPIREIVAIAARGTPEATEAVRKSTDKIYFFQMIAKGEAGAVAHTNLPAGPEGNDSLTIALGVVLGDKRKGEKEAKQVQRHYDALTPLAGGVTGNALVIKLGYTGPSCVPDPPPPERTMETIKIIDGKVVSP